MKCLILSVATMMLFTACGLINTPEEPLGSSGVSVEPQPLLSEQSNILGKLADIEHENGIVNDFAAIYLDIDSLQRVDSVPKSTSDYITRENSSKKLFSPDGQNYIEVFYDFKDVNYTDVSVVFNEKEIYSIQIWKGGGDSYNNVATWVNNEIIALGFNLWQDSDNYTASLFFVKTKEYQELEYPSFVVPLDGENTVEAHGKDVLYGKSPAPRNSFSPTGRYMLSYLEYMNGYTFAIYEIDNERWTQIYGGFKPPTKFFSPWVQWIDDETVRFSPLNAPRKGKKEYEQRLDGFVTLEYNIEDNEMIEIIKGETWGAYDDYIVCDNNEQESVLLYHVENKERLLYLPKSNLTYHFTPNFEYIYFLLDNYAIIYDAANSTKYIFNIGSEVTLEFSDKNLYFATSKNIYIFPE